MHIRFSMYKLLTGILIPIWRMTGLHQLRNLINRGFSISSNECLVEEEIKYIKNAFCTYNQFTEKMVDNIIKSERERQQKTLKYNEETKIINTTDVSEILTLILLYDGKKGDNIISRMQKNVLNVIAVMPTENKKN